MNLTQFVEKILYRTLLTISLAGLLTLATTGCRKTPVGVTSLPNATHAHPPINDDTLAKPLGETETVGSIKETPTGFPTGPGHPGWSENAGVFKAYTVHFDFDSHVVKNSEKGKVEAVANALKGNQAIAVKVEGHCDERGTEEYNRSLGERRALALREELIRMGIDPARVDTLSWGEDKPVSKGHDESAWKQNRRGVFIELSPPK